MHEAKKIMERKTLFKAEMDKVLPKSQSNALWSRSTEKLGEFLDRYRSLPEGVHTHTDTRIFPMAAVYLTLKDYIGQEKAYKIIEDAAISGCAGTADKLKKLLKLPGMKKVFIKAWDPMVRKLFGPDNGFSNVFYPKKAGEYRMDVTSCPYCRYLTELGCPELTKIFCANDDRIYGVLPGITFERTGTLGRGADRCDFCLKIK